MTRQDRSPSPESFDMYINMAATAEGYRCGPGLGGGEYMTGIQKAQGEPGTGLVKREKEVQGLAGLRSREL